MLVAATHTVCHLYFGHVEVLGASAEGLARHGVLYEGGVGDIGGGKPEGYVGASWLLFVGRLGLDGLLPCYELGKLCFVVLAEVATQGFDET